MIPRPSRVLVTNPDRQLPCHFSKTVLRIPSKVDRSSIKKRCSMYFAVENNKGLFKGSGSDDVLREKFARQLKWCTDVMDVFAP